MQESVDELTAGHVEDMRVRSNTVVANDYNIRPCWVSEVGWIKVVGIHTLC